jgi:aspartate-semialdehyde dehydrogenase
LDNIVPYISGEEGKIMNEAKKILGVVVAEESGSVGLSLSNVKISATCTRVPVIDGHTACVSVRFAQRPPPSIKDIKAAFREYASEAITIGCPSAPRRAVVVMEEEDRPQPRLDRDTEGGYSVSVGRVREDESGVFDVLFISLSHNSMLISRFVISVKVLVII